MCEAHAPDVKHDELYRARPANLYNAGIASQGPSNMYSLRPSTPGISALYRLR